MGDCLALYSANDFSIKVNSPIILLSILMKEWSILLTACLDCCYIVKGFLCPCNSFFFFSFFNASAGALDVAGGAGGSDGGEYNRPA